MSQSIEHVGVKLQPDDDGSRLQLKVVTILLRPAVQ